MRCKASYSVGDFAELECTLEAGHIPLWHDSGVNVWSNRCRHELVSNRADGRHAYCNKCYTSAENL